MACNHPLPAWRTREPLESGRYGVTFSHQLADTSRKLELPCGRCLGCRLEKSRQWGIRMLHEAKLWKHNYFVTLTYNETTLPRTVQGLPTLQPEDFVLFMKRLRKWNSKRSKGGGAVAPSPRPLPHRDNNTVKDGIRYYQCGEYGEQTKRPHHHAILFNITLNDLKPIHTARAMKNDAHTLYTSGELERIWGKGMVSIGKVTFETAAYVAGYVTKKITGPTAAAHYQGRVPEYATMSRRPGIGTGFLTKYADEIYTHDSVIIRGIEVQPPKAYDRILERRDPETYYEVQTRRALAEKHIPKHREREAREANIAAKARKRDAT